MFEITFPAPLVLNGAPYPMGLYIFGTVLALPFWRKPEGAPLALEIHAQLGTGSSEDPKALQERMMGVKGIRLSGDAYQALKREIALEGAQLPGEIAFVATTYALAVYQAKAISDSPVLAAAE